MINNVERIKKLKEENYQKIFGIKKNTFDKMLKLLNESYRIEHLRGGHPPKLSVLDRLVIMLSYYRDYRTMENIAFEYGVAKSKEDRKYNSIISRRRIYIEHVNRHIKRFRIVSTRYRNKRRKFALRFSLICAILILNYKLSNRSIHIFYSFSPYFYSEVLFSFKLLVSDSCFEIVSICSCFSIIYTLENKLNKIPIITMIF